MKKIVKGTKAQIVQAAIKLFSVQGFGSTSIREIAESAQVNSALISYHFKNKQGILEWIMIQYFEGLFDTLNTYSGQALEKRDCFEELMAGIKSIIQFQSDHIEVSRIIQRELSVDSMLVREVMSTYIARLKAYLTELLERGMELQQFRELDLDMQVIHMMSGLFFPYFNPQIMREVFYVEPMSDEFSDVYVSFLSKILEIQLKI